MGKKLKLGDLNVKSFTTGKDISGGTGTISFKPTVKLTECNDTTKLTKITCPVSWDFNSCDLKSIHPHACSGAILCTGNVVCDQI